jgi:serine protease DegQ
MSTNQGVLQSLSHDLEAAVESASRSVVRIDDGTRLTASGTIWTSDGIIVATSHGVESDEDLTIETSDGAIHKATLVGRDPDSDLAVLKVDAKDLPAVPRAPADSIKVGGLVLAVGRPGRAGLQATLGIVSSIHGRRIKTEEGRLIHTDAVFYPGFSGGALVNTDGQFIGLVNVGFGRGRGVAFGATLINETVEALLQNGAIKRGYLGIASQPARLPEGVPTKQTIALLVTSVVPGSAAHLGGILLGDAILTINETAVADPHELRHVLRNGREGDQAILEVLRSGEVRTLNVTLGARP